MLNFESMKRIILILLLCAFLPSALYAAEIEEAGTALRKLQRGFVNIALSPFEIASELHKANQKDTAIPSWMIGSVKGIGMTTGRALTGVYELVTFPFPIPSGYQPIIHPEFPWELVNS